MRLFLIILSGFHVIGCSFTVEVPKGKAGIVINRNSSVEGRVLVHGIHNVHVDQEILLFDLDVGKIDFKFSYILKDAVSGKTEFSVRFSPVVNRLPEFYERYKSENVNAVVESEVRSIVRQLMQAYTSNEFRKDEMESKIKYELKNHGLCKFVNLEITSSIVFE